MSIVGTLHLMPAAKRSKARLRWSACATVYAYGQRGVLLATFKPPHLSALLYHGDVFLGPKRCGSSTVQERPHPRRWRGRELRPPKRHQPSSSGLTFWCFYQESPLSRKTKLDPSQEKRILPNLAHHSFEEVGVTGSKEANANVAVEHRQYELSKGSADASEWRRLEFLRDED